MDFQLDELYASPEVILRGLTAIRKVARLAGVMDPALRRDWVADTWPHEKNITPPQDMCCLPEPRLAEKVLGPPC